MASVGVAERPQERPNKRRPFSNWVKKIANFKGHEPQDRKSGAPPCATKPKQKKSSTQNGSAKNNPYPESGRLPQPRHSPSSSVNGALSFAHPTSHAQHDTGSYTSLPTSALEEKETQSRSNRSNAPTVATDPETIHSDAGQSKAPTTATGPGALSSRDGAGAGSTFSSPNQSTHSLTTTLTTIQSQSPGNTLQAASSGHISANSHHGIGPANPVMFTHQYPVSPAPSTPATISAIPRHISDAMPNTYNSATANNLLSDDASILTLASSSKRRRRSMDTDASVRAIPPTSVWGGSRESLPLSVLSANPDPGLPAPYPPSRPSIGGFASPERASIYSSQGVSAPALASERNSYYAASHKQPAKDLGDAKSLRSITNLDARSQYDARSITDAKSMEVGSLRNYEGSMRSGAMGHGRNDSIPGSIGTPLASPKLASNGGALSRRSSDWQGIDGKEQDEDHDVAAVRKENEAAVGSRAPTEETG